MNAKKAVYRFDDQPIVRVRLENPHDASILPFEVRALIDTGAQACAIPAYLCQTLGHSFEEGVSESYAAGIGAGAVRTFTHSTKLTVLFPNESDTEPPQTFEPIEFSCDFIDQPLPFVLLGQRDFLRLFRYAQDGSAGWFSLEQITAN
jgi:hypothetical protein